MPYQKLNDLPPAVKVLPAHGQEIWMAAFNSAWDQYKGDEEKCFAVAWSAVKEKYRKEGDKWIEMNAPDFPEWIEVFSTGTWTDAAGNTSDWTLEDLQEIVSSYKPEIYDAPIVIGHPETDSPAYGWIEALKVEGEKLLAKPGKLINEFKDWVKQGLYKKISISLFPDMSLRHVGFLGGVAPAVKGLKPIAFTKKKAGWVFEKEIQMGDQSTEKKDQADGPEGALARREARSKKYNIAVKEGGNVTKPGEWSSVGDDDFLDPVNYRYPCPNADQTRAAAAYWGKPDNQIQYSSEERALISKRLAAKEKQYNIGEQTKQGGTKMREFFEKMKALFTEAEKELTPDPNRKFTEADIQAAEKRVKDAAFAETEKIRKEKEESDKKLKDIETKARKDGIHAFCEGLAKEGKIIPAWQKMGIEEFIFNLDSGESIKFAESDGGTKTRSQWFMDFLTELPKVVTFKEIAGTAGLGSGGSAAEKLSALTKAKMEAKKDLSYGAAFSEVQKENPELAKEALVEIRPQ